MSLVLILTGSAAGLLLYGYSSLQNYKKEAVNLISYSMSMQDIEYIERLFRETRSVYSSMPDDVRKDPTSDAFLEAVAPLADDDYEAARDILVKCREKTGQRNVFLMFTDPEHSAIVYVVDGDEDEWAFLPGQWMEEDLDKLESVQRSSWRLIMTYNDEYGWIGTDCEKIYSSNGDEIGYAVMDLDLNAFLGRVFGFLTVLLPVALLIVVVLASLSDRLLRRHIITHLTSMASAARDYTAMDKMDISEETKSVFEPLGIRTADELEDLWLSMTGMESDFKRTMIRLRDVTAEQERAGAELSIAAQIQMGTLPRSYPERNEFVLHAYMNPAKEVGGDLYDFFMIDDDHLAIVIADVAGKGVTASLFMVIAQTLIRSETDRGLQDPADIFTRVNRRLVEINTTHTFVTAWLGILNVRTGEVTYVDAGHECPAIRRKGELFIIEKDIHCVPLAARKKAVFESGSLRLGSGDTIYLYTDGVTEANVTVDDLFGKERLLDVLNREPDAMPDIIDKNVTDAIDGFVGGAPQFDDTTMLCLRYCGPDDSREE